ncbi:MAG: hypothetical protein HQL47_11075 [Gammaproteobacteria bacterium]|nr:hypothetical protein [Gammaproteobacteria bacterium]
MAGLQRKKPKPAPQVVAPGQLLADDSAQERALQPDFSPQAVSRAVLRASAQNPLVLYPLTLGLLGGLAAALLSPSVIFLAAAGLGASLGLGSWLADLTLRRHKHAGRYLQQMHQLLQTRVRHSIKQLQADLEHQGSERGLSQLRRLEDKFAAFQALLQRKLDPAELTYSRYLGMTEQVFLAGLDNLGRVVSILQGVRVIDEADIRQRLLQLDQQQPRSAAHEGEYQALSERLHLRQSQLEKIDNLLMQNETAMTRMDQIMAAIAEMDSTQPRATMDMESAMQELQRLAERAHSYSN